MSSYYQLNYALKRNGFSIEEIENLIAYERDIYLMLLEEEIKKKKDAAT